MLQHLLSAPASELPFLIHVLNLKFMTWFLLCVALSEHALPTQVVPLNHAWVILAWFLFLTCLCCTWNWGSYTDVLRRMTLTCITVPHVVVVMKDKKKSFFSITFQLILVSTNTQKQDVFQNEKLQPMNVCSLHFSVYYYKILHNNYDGETEPQAWLISWLWVFHWQLMFFLFCSRQTNWNSSYCLPQTLAQYLTSTLNVI